MKQVSLFIFCLLISVQGFSQSYSIEDLTGKWVKEKETDESGEEINEELIPISTKPSKPDTSVITQILIFGTDGYCQSAFGNEREIVEDFGQFKFELIGVYLIIGESKYEIMDITGKTLILKEIEENPIFPPTLEHFRKLE